MLIRALFWVLFSGITSAAPALPALKYSTYLRDSFTPNAVATDPSGNIYLAGNAIVDPATSQSTVLVVKLNPRGSQYLYVRYLGGSVRDSANAIAVDAAGNAYIAGSTASPDFPVTSGGHLGTAPAGLTSQRSFVVKLDPGGTMVFSDLIGGAAASAAQAIAVTTAGQAVVSGIVSDVAGPAFPSTEGAYRIANTANHPYLLELDPAGTKTIFSATGIGGSAVALDAAGNIYVAGSTFLLDYPTTPGAYQSTLPAFEICSSPPCVRTFQGANQYVTKVDPSGSKLIYSTAVSGNGNTANGGLAVDEAGNVYLTGYAGPGYPYSVTPPAIPVGPVNSIFFFELPFLSKLDAAGKTLLFSVPVGGAGVRVDSQGAVYVSGGAGAGPAGSFGIGNNLPVLAGVPAACLPNSRGIRSAAYVAEVDAASGVLVGSQFIGGSTLVTSALALSGSTVWVAGAATRPDFPLTLDAMTLPDFGLGELAGAYLGAVDFSQPAALPETPRIFCIVDSADMSPVGAVPRYQLLTILGTGLGPVAGVAAGDTSNETLAGVRVRVGPLSAPLLYVSSTQINFAVPLVDAGENFAAVQVAVDNAGSDLRRIPLTYSARPRLFLSPAREEPPSIGAPVLALNSDGSVNSSTNPAPLGSVVSVFANGLTPDPRMAGFPVQLGGNNGWSVTGIAPANPFVLQVELRVPSALVNQFSCVTSAACSAGFKLFPVGEAASGEPFEGVVWVDRSR